VFEQDVIKHKRVHGYCSNESEEMTAGGVEMKSKLEVEGLHKYIFSTFYLFPELWFEKHTKHIAFTGTFRISEFRA
jgi:hypothetical protein